MSCKKLISSNSTFCYWCGLLGNSDEIIVPKKLFSERVLTSTNKEEEYIDMINNLSVEFILFCCVWIIFGTIDGISSNLL